MSSTITIILALIGSQGFFSLIILLINRRDNKKNVVNEIKSELTRLNDKVDKNEATRCRHNILIFADEIESGVYHSKESFRNQLQMCDYYEKYCKKNPDFENGYTVLANELIHRKYEELYMN